MFTVWPESRSAIFWSESGFFESSFSMISLMRFLTLSEATNSPSLVESPLLKKYLSSSPTSKTRKNSGSFRPMQS
jgi:hypothetical protein